MTISREKALELLTGGEQGVREWNGLSLDERSDVQLSRANLEGADLRQVNLAGLNLQATNLGGANLDSADLRDAYCRDASFKESDLSRAAVRDATLEGVDLQGASLEGADLRGADLGNVSLECATLFLTVLLQTSLDETDFMDVTADGLIISGVDLTTAKNLELVKHRGPSHIDSHTLQRSKGQIPDVFLRGCGFSPWEVEMARLYSPEMDDPGMASELATKLVMARTHGPIYLGGVFISYSHANSTFVGKIYDRLYEAGASVWRDIHDMDAGDMNKQVKRSLRIQDVVLLVLSEASVKSDWVEHELDLARKKERKKAAMYCAQLHWTIHGRRKFSVPTKTRCGGNSGRRTC